MKLAHAFALGAVQGLTEFLPVSSSGHLVLLRHALGHEEHSPAFDVTLHLATTTALLTAAHGDLLPPARALLRDAARHKLAVGRYGAAARLGLLAVAANLPAVVTGALLDRTIADMARRPRSVAVMLALGSLAMAVAERVAPEGTGCGRSAVTVRDALIVGLAQAVALLPGVSRSGATIAAGLAAGLDRPAAVRFSFLLAAPVTLAAGVRALWGRGAMREAGAAALAVGSTAAFLTGLVGIALLRRLVGQVGLTPFVIYRLGLAAVAGWRQRRP